MTLLIALLTIEEVQGTPNVGWHVIVAGCCSTNRKVTFFGSRRLKTYLPRRVLVGGSLQAEFDALKAALGGQVD